MKVLLVYPNAHREIIGYMDLGAIAEPLALEYVAAGVRQDGHEVKLLDLRIHREALDEVVTDFEPDVVGLTGYSMHVLRNLDACRRIKELRPQCRTAVGGHHATLEPVDFREPQVDHVCTGSGVEAFREVVRQVESGREAPIPGTWSRIGGEFQWGGPEVAFDANKLPRPDRACVPADRPHYFIDKMKPVALMRTSVGCPYRCTFCSLWRIMDGKYYTREVEEVVDELASIPERHVHFADDEPFVNPTRMNVMAECIERRGVQKEYYAYCRVDSFLRDKDLMRRWAALGLKRLFFGVETVLERELADYNKRTTLRQNLEAMAFARELGIGLFCGFIVHPSYGPHEFAELKRFIRENGVEYPSFTIWTPIPGIMDGGTDYSPVVVRQPNGRPDWSKFDLQHPTIGTRLPVDEFMGLYGSLYEVSYFGEGSSKPATPVPSDEELRRLKLIDLARRVLGGSGAPN